MGPDVLPTWYLNYILMSYLYDIYSWPVKRVTMSYLLVGLFSLVNVVYLKDLPKSMTRDFWDKLVEHKIY